MLAHIYPGTGRARRAGPTNDAARVRFHSVLALVVLGLCLFTSSPAAADSFRLLVEMDRTDAELGDRHSSFTLFDSYSLPSDGPVSLPLFFELSWTSKGTRHTAHEFTTYDYAGGKGEMLVWHGSPYGTYIGSMRVRLGGFAFSFDEEVIGTSSDSGPQVDGPSGVGRLDARLARFLGVERKVSVDTDFLLDRIHDTPWGRIAYSGCCGYVDMTLTESDRIPEPAAMTLQGLGLLCGVAALRRRVAR
jgi:hypothetical protein